jgi:hypothetical protein
MIRWIRSPQTVLHRMQAGARLTYQRDYEDFLLGGTGACPSAVQRLSAGCIERLPLSGDPFGVGAEVPFRVVNASSINIYERDILHGYQESEC